MKHVLGTNEHFTISKNGTDTNVDEQLSKCTEITYADLVTLRNNSGLVAGMWYRITDYECTTTQTDTRSAGHVFDIIVRADDVNVLNENAYAAHHAGDTYFANSKLEAWKLLYCLDNVNWSNKAGKSALLANGASLQYIGNTEQIQGQTWYTWSNSSPGYPWSTTFYTSSQNPSSGDAVMGYAMGGFSKYSTISSVIMLSDGKGTILKMIDEHNNECPYDFKNIQFKVGAKEKAGTVANVFYYTFSVASGTNDATVTDHSLNGFYCYDNRIEKYIFDSEHELNFNIFRNTATTNYCHNNTFGNSCNNNTFGNSCYYNTFGDSCRYNTFGNSCYSNTFGDDCYYNTFGDSCRYNTFGNNCGSNISMNNTFGNSCYSNTFGDDCNSNTFGNSCNNNTFGNSCYYNTFGDSCRYNTFGNSCNGNTFGNECSYNIFGGNCGYNKFLKEYSYFIIIESGNQYINITSTQTTSSSQVLRNFTVAQGVNNSNSTKTISHNTTNDTFKTIYQNANSTTTNV